MRLFRRPETWVFAVLLGSFTFFWHARDWNSASRLMLTYALVDRGTICLDGLEHQTGDIAWFRGRYYTDKLPGYSLLATSPYALAKHALGYTDHPLNVQGFAYWPADYWTTLGTSGVLSALCGAVLTVLAQDLGCGPRRALLVGLGYGLATPAYVYATISVGHQASAAALLGSFALLWREEQGRPAWRAFAAGFLAALAPVVELQVGPVSAILTAYLVVLVLGRKRRPARLGEFLVGAALPTLVLLGYNQLAFGSPWDMGYFHHANAGFHNVHNRNNPLGLRGIAWDHVIPLLWGGYRGLLFYAPLVILAPPGWVALAARGFRGMAAVSAATVAAIFLVNLSYPEWTGGWSTGPRLLVPLLPFAMLPVAGLLGAGGRATTAVAAILALVGGVLMLLFQGVGGAIPPDVGHPLLDAVWPLWRGDPLPTWAMGRRFIRTAVSVLFPSTIAGLPERRRWVQFVPLVLAQALAIAAACRAVRAGKPDARPVEPTGTQRGDGR